MAVLLDGEILSREVLAEQRHSELILPMLRQMLLQGQDAVGLTLEHVDDIARFERAYVAQRPWLA